MDILLHKVNFRFAFFLGSYSFVIKSVICFLRYLRKVDDGKNAFLAGFLAGLTLFIEKKQSNRYLFRMYLCNRVFDILYKALVNREILSHRKRFAYSLVYSLCSSFIARSYFAEPIICENDILNLY